MEQEQEAFAIQYHECTKLNGSNIIIFICRITKLKSVYFNSTYPAIKCTTINCTSTTELTKNYETERIIRTTTKSEGIIINIYTTS